MPGGVRGGWTANFVTDPFDGIAMPQGFPRLPRFPHTPYTPLHPLPFQLQYFYIEISSRRELASRRLTFTFLCSVAQTLIAFFLEFDAHTRSHVCTYNYTRFVYASFAFSGSRYVKVTSVISFCEPFIFLRELTLIALKSLKRKSGWLYRDIMCWIIHYCLKLKSCFCYVSDVGSLLL